VVLFEWETGAEPAEDGPGLKSSFETLGAITARMHAHVRDWKRPAGFERLTWDFDTSLGPTPHWGAWRDGMGLTPELQDLFQRTVDLIERRLAAFGKGPERFGLIHCDMRLANLLLDGDTTKVIDFDDCGFSWLLYDCATTVSFFEHKPEVPDLLEAWVRGYRSVSPLPAEDEAEIPTFVMLRRLLLVAWIGSHAETDLAQSMGVDYTRQTAPLCEAYLAMFG
jgi:Ser/Thr protein kinase RdoA (MazF antagonist)